MCGDGVSARIAEWLRRYLPAETVAIVCTLVAGVAASRAGGHPTVVALAGTWGENAGYYGTMFLTEIGRGRARAGGRGVGGSWRALRNLALEFGPAEALDSLLVRPAAMYAGAAITGSVPLGLLLGKLAADVAFYGPAIAAYELRKKYLGE